MIAVETVGQFESSNNTSLKRVVNETAPPLSYTARQPPDLDLLLPGELVTGIKFRHRRRIGNASPNRHREIGFLNHAAKIPIVMKLVGRLVIMRLVIFPEFFLAPLFGVSDVVAALFQTDRGHADFREWKMIRTIKRSLLGPRIGRDAQPSFARDFLNNRFQRRTLRAQRDKVARWSENVH